MTIFLLYSSFGNDWSLEFLLSHKLNFGDFFFLENHICHPDSEMDLHKAENIVTGGLLNSSVVFVISML